jgi:hypothetical protein
MERCAGYALGILVVVVAAGTAMVPSLVLAQRSESAKVMQAVRIVGPAPRIDGRLDDAAWRRARFASDFVERDPTEGGEPSACTLVAFLFDDDALYVGARMETADPRGVRALLTRRDHAGTSEQLIVSIDSYFDRRTAYTFAVTAAGVRMDYYQATDDEHDRDYSFDPVWQAAAVVDSVGWTAELRIPFSQLRFHEGPHQTWGVNVRRRIPSRNEDIFWVLVKRDETGWASRFGTLVGLDSLRPPSRTEVMPYVGTNYVAHGNREPGDPFARNRLSQRAGADIKTGVGPNMTVDATINPDFGQVEADPAVVNLSAFETIFEERRPFFTEGRHLLEGDGPTYFYSRRIGAAPHGTLSSDFVDEPKSTTILGAAKISGQLAAGLSLAALSAVTERVFARGFDTQSSEFDRGLVEPRTGFFVARVQQEFGTSSSTVGAMVTAMRRGLSDDMPITNLLDREAYSGGGDWRLRFDHGRYELAGFVGGSYVAGSTDAILDLQQSSARYFQRPDAPYVRLDSMRRELAGYTGSVQLKKAGGRHWLWDVAGVARSPGFEINDVGRLSAADVLRLTSDLIYRETHPGARLRDYAVTLSSFDEWNYGGILTARSPQLSLDATWRNYWSTHFTATYDAPVLSDKLTRGGPLMRDVQSLSADVEMASDPANRSQWATHTSLRRDDTGGWKYELDGQWSTRPRERWELSVTPRYSRGVDARQFIEREHGGANTYGQRYIFAATDRAELAAEFRINYVLAPDVSLELYAEPFAASGHYFQYGELQAPRSGRLRLYGTDGTTVTRESDGAWTVSDGPAEFTLGPDDFNIRSFRSSAVARWEWRAGSTLFLIWQQDLSGECPDGRLVTPHSLWESLQSRGDNYLALKASFWLTAP